MSTTIKPEVSKRNRYFVEKHRYYELVHFCRQYDYWKLALRDLTYLKSRSIDEPIFDKRSFGDPTTELAFKRMYYSDRIDMIEKAVSQADVFLAPFLLEAVTKGVSYSRLRQDRNIPCSRDIFYDAYRKFFWILHGLRD